MIEKVNPCHPDKVADRIAGAIVDLAYKTEKDPKIAVEVLIGHGVCYVIVETSADIFAEQIKRIVHRIAGQIAVISDIKPQDKHLADNQADGFRCGDNGIFKGVPLTDEEKKLSVIARDIYKAYPFDGKYILDGERLIICQSNAKADELKQEYPDAEINPIGDWTGGTDVDTGATNRKLGSDMADSVTGGGLHGKDLSKADVSVNIYAFLKAQKTGKPVELFTYNGTTYAPLRAICEAAGIGLDDMERSSEKLLHSKSVEQARQFIRSVGGFEAFAEWGLY